MLVSKCTITVPPLKVPTPEELASPSPISFPFYLAQFFSNFFKYLFSNLLSFHPNKILAVYFPSNSLFLNSSAFGFNSIFVVFCFSFFFSTCYISSSLISFSNSSTKSIAFFKFSNPSQVSSSAIYSFHLTKYFGFPLLSRLSKIFSISTRGGGIFFYPSTCS